MGEYHNYLPSVFSLLKCSPYQSLYDHLFQVLVNYASNSLCDERTYQPNVSVSYSGNSLCNEHMYVPALYGALVNYYGNCSYD